MTLNEAKEKIIIEITENRKLREEYEENKYLDEAYQCFCRESGLLFALRILEEVK